MITFDEATHKYWGDEMQELTPVTALLKQYGITSDYSFVNEAVLEKACNLGTEVHKDIENYLQGSDNFTHPEHVERFIEITKAQDITWFGSELIVGNKAVAGTIDHLGNSVEGIILCDTKTGSTVNKMACRWQLSIYAELLFQSMGQVVNKIAVIHNRGDKSKFIPLDYIPLFVVRRLLTLEQDRQEFMEILEGKL